MGKLPGARVGISVSRRVAAPQTKSGIAKTNFGPQEAQGGIPASPAKFQAPDAKQTNSPSTISVLVFGLYEKLIGIWRIKNLGAARRC
jgi:hypothetical protein